MPTKQSPRQRRTEPVHQRLLPPALATVLLMVVVLSALTVVVVGVVGR